MAHALLSSSEQIGMFLGLAIHDTAQVVGSAITYASFFALFFLMIRRGPVGEWVRLGGGEGARLPGLCFYL